MNRRPRDLALLLLASGDHLPRQRARDQQADRVGLELKGLLLNRLAERDPAPDELKTVLAAIVEELPCPSGPARAIARGILEEWQVVSHSPGWITMLESQASAASAPSEQMAMEP